MEFSRAIPQDLTTPPAYAGMDWTALKAMTRLPADTAPFLNCCIVRTAVADRPASERSDPATASRVCKRTR